MRYLNQEYIHAYSGLIDEEVNVCFDVVDSGL